ncbi:MAG: chitin deacetylase family protein [Gemmatimonadota bacterium]
MELLVPIVLGLSLIGSAVTAIPTLVVEWARHDTPEVVFYAETSQPVVALTIDDGPSEATSEILEVLDEYGVRATFFLIGEHLRAHLDLARRLVRDGHELGNHMMVDEPSIDLSPEAFHSQLLQMDRLLEGFGGSHWFRPGSGWYDDRMVEEAGRLGYTTVLGSVYPFDAQVSAPWLSSWYVSNLASPGAIIVLHDGAERGPRTADALRSILPDLLSRGYRVVPLGELLGERGRGNTSPP